MAKEDNEYTKQLILACLESISQYIYPEICPKMETQAAADDMNVPTTVPAEEAQVIEEHYQSVPETIVQCIRGNFPPPTGSLPLSPRASTRAVDSLYGD